MSLDLRPYDPNAWCNKCHSQDVATEWHDATHEYLTRHRCAYVDASGTRWVGENLCRRCVRCGYRWFERTMDAAPADA